MILPIPDREKINLKLPSFTLDVNQVALKDPANWSSAMQGLAPLEWNYFEVSSVELCVTPETPFEIKQSQTVASLPYTAYRRFNKTQLFKSRPPGVTLHLSEQEANEVWSGIRDILWPTVHGDLNQRQLSDVKQLYYHTVSSGSTCYNSAFLTIDNHFLSKRRIIASQLGVSVLTPSEAWDEYRTSYNLYNPTQDQIGQALVNQQNILLQMSTRCEST